MKKELHKLSLIGTCFLFLTLTACNSKPVSNTTSEASPSTQPTTSTQQSTVSSQPTASSSTTTNVYPEPVVKRFTEACAKDRGAKVQEVCNCAIKEIQNKYTLEQFRKVVQDAKANGQPTSEIRQIIQSCRASNS